MMMQGQGIRGLGLLVVLVVSLAGCTKMVETHRVGGLPEVQVSAPAQPLLATDERLVTFLQTNDIHGGIEVSIRKDGTRVGGMALWGSVVQSIRQGLQNQFGDRAGVLLLDGGDQFQGSLLSNFDEGQLLFSMMDQMGYTAVVPGNHDYDFGPIGWLEDKVKATSVNQDSRGALLRLVQQVRFPLLSANTFYTSSLVDWSGKPVAPANVGCGLPSSAAANAKPMAPELRPIDWSKAIRPEFLKPYLIQDVAGVRVAIIGIDNPVTPQITTPQNVSDLCFDDEAEAYLRVRAELEGKADVFVMLLHNVRTEKEFIDKINANGRNLDLILAGHTHQVTKETVSGVPIIQSGSNGKMFGRIDLVWDTVAKRIVTAKTKVVAGATLFEKACDGPSKGFCVEKAGVPVYEGVKAEPGAASVAAVEAARMNLAVVSARQLGQVQGNAPISVNRIMESALGDRMTDVLREVSGADVAFVNAGGLRADLGPGVFSYDDFFHVMPFNNIAVVLDPVSREVLLKLLMHSAQTCGRYGALLPSGLKATFERDCKNQPVQNEIDPNARLIHVETLAGLVIFDSATPGLDDLVVGPDQHFRVATLDFLAAGGDGLDFLKTIPQTQELGILREVLTTRWLAQPADLSSGIDGRWKELHPAPASSPVPSPAPSAVPSFIPLPLPSPFP